MLQPVKMDGTGLALPPLTTAPSTMAVQWKCKVDFQMEKVVTEDGPPGTLLKPPPQGDRAAHIDAFKAAIGCIEIIAKDPPWHQRILRHSESAR